MKAAENIIEECYERSRALLGKNAHDHGVVAAARTRKAVDRGYASVFGRDAAICALGMAASGDSGLVRHAEKSLLTLARFQAPNGQIPKYVKPESREVDFWTRDASTPRSGGSQQLISSTVPFRARASRRSLGPGSARR